MAKKSGTGLDVAIFILGVETGVVLSIVGVAWTVPHQSDFLNSYQTLITGSLAVIAAAVGGYLLNRQIRQADDHAEDLRERKNYAAASLATHALNDVADFALQCVQVLLALRQTVKEYPRVNVSLNIPTKPTHAIEIIASNIENMPRNVRPMFRQLLEVLQIQHSVLMTFAERCRNGVVMAGPTLDNRIRDAVEVYARTGPCFPKAREDPDKLPSPLNASEWVSAARNCAVSKEPDMFDELVNICSKAQSVESSH